METSAYAYYFKTRKEFKNFYKNDSLGIKQKCPKETGCYGYDLSNLLSKYDFNVKANDIDLLLSRYEIIEIYDDIKNGKEPRYMIAMVKQILQTMELSECDYVYFGNFLNCYYDFD